jgi:hypothetical protein
MKEARSSPLRSSRNPPQPPPSKTTTLRDGAIRHDRDVDQTKAEEYAKSWIEAWNAHDLDALAAHYADDVVFLSPFIPKLIENAECTLRGREELKAYLSKGMEAYPHMRFQLHRVGVGVDSLALNYIGVDGALANEVHVLNSDGKASEVRIHYSAAL